LTGIADGLIEKMTGEQITLIVVVYFLLFFGQSFARSWVEKHYEQKCHDREAREREKVSDEETRRAQIMADALVDAMARPRGGSLHTEEPP